MSGHRVSLCRLGELTPSEARRFEVEEPPHRRRSTLGNVCAIGDRCTDQSVPSEGEVDEDERLLEGRSAAASSR